MEHGRKVAAVEKALRELIVDGSLAPGERLRELQLARRFKVSRTPLRQALTSLCAEGLIISSPNIGFSVASMSREEVLELYPIVWTLEVLALEASFEALQANTERLREINARMRRKNIGPLMATTYDREFHEALTGLSSNKRLRQITHEEKLKLLRYETMYMASSSLVLQSTKEHDDIITAIESGSLSKARESLIANWRRGMWAVVAQITQDNSVPR